MPQGLSLFVGERQPCSIEVAQFDRQCSSTTSCWIGNANEQLLVCLANGRPKAPRINGDQDTYHSSSGFCPYLVFAGSGSGLSATLLMGPVRRVILSVAQQPLALVWFTSCQPYSRAPGASSLRK